MEKRLSYKSQECHAHIGAVRDALYVLNGKWKLPLIATLMDGPKRFSELQKTLETITPRVLSKELKELELNEFIERRIYPTTPVSVIYELTPYSKTLEKVLNELKDWGAKHRQRIVEGIRQETLAR